ncbi:MAG: hypothetical protein R3234_11405, partial [Thermoanaerobaculia bacterium]|nr:hypothetical protein [Thermoanaerobaculia bacterium]
MNEALLSRRHDVLSDTLGKFLRRGAESHVAKILSKTRPEDVAAVLRNLEKDERLEVFRILN